MSPPNHQRNFQMNLLLSKEQKDMIEDAAVISGQSMSNFAASTLVKASRQIVEQENITVLTNRDRDIFIALLDDKKASPNQALKAAAQRYKSRQKKS